MPGQIVFVVVIVCIHRQALGNIRTKQFDKRRVIADLLRFAMATNMVIQANHLISSGHHQLQVMRDCLLYTSPSPRDRG